MSAAVVQAVGVRSVGAVTSLTTSAFTPAAGNHLVVGWVTNYASGLASGVVSDSVSQVWVQDAPTDGFNHTQVGIASALTVTGGSQAITLTPSAASYCALSIVEWSGLAAREETAVGHDGTGDVPSPGALAPTSPADAYVAVGSDENADGPTTAADASAEGWTMQYQSEDRVNMPIYLQTLVSGTGAKTGSFRLSGAGAWFVWVACAAAFRAADVPAPDPNAAMHFIAVDFPAANRGFV